MMTLIKTIFWSFVVTLTLLLATFYIGKASASDFIELREVNVDFKQFFKGGFSPLINDNGLPNKLLDKGLDLNLNTDILGWGYWDNRVNSLVDKDEFSPASQFRVVGWNIRLGFRPFSFTEVGYWHHSQHILDSRHKSGRFMVEDGVEIKIIIFDKYKKNSVF